jgi:alkaline phosphatase D
MAEPRHHTRALPGATRRDLSRRNLGRRAFLAGAAGTAGLSVLGGWPGLLGRTTPAWPARRDPLPTDPFSLGVASGDPLSDRVVLWTRLAPAPLQGGGMPGEAVEVTWQVATDPGFTTVVRSGTATAVPDHAHSVHVDADGLEPDGQYWYRFSVPGWESPTGRTRTAPPPDRCAEDARLRFAYATCQNYTNGYYTAHHHLAAEQVDVVFFLGDYIYEGGVGSGVRPHNSPQVTTLPAYRNRYGLYKSDPDLQAAHASAPWIVTWDDHEVHNNYAGDIDQDGSDPAAFLPRRAAAYQAWWEHQPVRLPPPVGPDLRIHRSFAWGRLASFFVLDGRQYRTDQPCGDGIGLICDDVFDPDQTMLGAAQEGWLADGLLTSGAQWNLIPQQVVMTALPIGEARVFDMWDGYPLARQRLLDVLGRPEVSNPVVLSGDIHAAGISDLLADFEDPDSAVVAHELVCTSISSNFPPELAGPLETIASALPWSHYVNARQRGYSTAELTAGELRTTYRVVDTVAEPTAAVHTDHVWSLEVEAPACPVTSVPEDPGGPADPDVPPSAAPPSTGTTPVGADHASTTSRVTSPEGATAPAASPVVGRPTFTG